MEENRRMGVIPTSAQGFIDYLVALILLLAPNIFRFSDVGGAAVSVPRTLGIILIVYSLLTRYEWGLIKIIPMSFHLFLDFLLGVYLIASPFLYNFNNEKSNAWIPHIAAGILVVLVALFSQTQSSEEGGGYHASTSPR